MHFELSTLIAWISPWIVNIYSKFQVNIFSYNRDVTKCQSFSMTTTTLIRRTPRLWQYLGFYPKTTKLRMVITSIFFFSHNVFTLYFQRKAWLNAALLIKVINQALIMKVTNKYSNKSKITLQTSSN